MSLDPLSNQLRAEDILLDSIYLDPNNPRFVDSNWSNVPDQYITDSDVQERTRRLLVQNFDIDKLQMNMEVNGYLPIDRVIVKEISEGKYVVLEGNRRICAAKMISSVAKDGSEVLQEVLDSLNKIPVLIYTGGDVEASWIFQGLRHISGVHDWSAFNKAKLLVEQMEKEGLNLTDVGRRFGLTPHGAGQWVRGFYAFKQAKEQSDFIAEVDERSYPYFQELFNRSSAAVRDWIGWDDENRAFKSQINFNEFVSWLYPKEESSEDEGIPGHGNFEKRWLARRDDIRTVAYLIREEPEFFQQFRSAGKLEETYSQALAKQYERQAKQKADPISELFDSIKTCTKALENLPLKVMKDTDLKNKLDELIEDLEKKIDYVKS